MKTIKSLLITALLLALCLTVLCSCGFGNKTEDPIKDEANVETNGNEGNAPEEAPDNTEKVKEETIVLPTNLFFFGISERKYVDELLTSEEFYSISDSLDYLIADCHFNYEYDNNKQIKQITITINNGAFTNRSTKVFVFEIQGSGEYLSKDDDLPLSINLHENGLIKELIFGSDSQKNVILYDELGRVIRETNYYGYYTQINYQNDSDLKVKSYVTRTEGEELEADYSYSDAGKSTFEISNDIKLFVEYAEDNSSVDFGVEYYEGEEFLGVIATTYLLNGSKKELNKYYAIAYENGEVNFKRNSNISLETLESGDEVYIVTDTTYEKDHKLSTEKYENGEYIDTYYYHDCYEITRRHFIYDENGQWTNVTPEEETINETAEKGNITYFYSNGEFYKAIYLEVIEQHSPTTLSKYNIYEYSYTPNYGCISTDPTEIQNWEIIYDESSRESKLIGVIDNEKHEYEYVYGEDGIIIKEIEDYYIDGEKNYHSEAEYHSEGKTTKTYHFTNGEVQFYVVTEENLDGVLISITYYTPDGEEFVPTYPGMPPIVVYPQG